MQVKLTDEQIDAMSYFQIMVWAIRRGNFDLALEAARYADERAARQRDIKPMED
jgi:hypothetical protein